MGFSSGENGVKRVVVSTLCPRAIHRAPSVDACLDDLRPEYAREATAIFRDANILMVGQVPSNVLSLDEWVQHILQVVLGCLRLAHILWLCIDDPEKSPDEKKDTQAKRQKRLKLEDECVPKDDNYGLAEILSQSDCHALVRNRDTRYRFVDEAMIRVFERLKEVWAQEPSYWTGTVIFDSVDDRGAQRPAYAPRQLKRLFVSRRQTVERALSSLGHLEGSPGEADLKLRVAEETMRLLCKWGDFKLSLLLVDTIDTDQIAISLLHAAERRDAKDVENPPVLALMMRERGKYAAEQMREYRQSIGAPVLGSSAWFGDDAGVLLLDIDACHDALDRLAYKANLDRRSQATWTRLLIGAWALSGCDFVDPTARCDRLTNAFWEVASRYGSFPALNKALQPGGWFHQRAVALLQEVLELAQNVPYSCATSRRARIDSDTIQRRIHAAIWASSYWSLQANIVEQPSS